MERWGEPASEKPLPPEIDIKKEGSWEGNLFTWALRHEDQSTLHPESLQGPLQGPLFHPSDGTGY